MTRTSTKEPGGVRRRRTLILSWLSPSLRDHRVISDLVLRGSGHYPERPRVLSFEARASPSHLRMRTRGETKDALAPQDENARMPKDRVAP